MTRRESSHPMGMYRDSFALHDARGEHMILDTNFLPVGRFIALTNVLLDTSPPRCRGPPRAVPN
jgi:hypothetical protein